MQGNLSKSPTYQKYLLDIMALYKQRSDLKAYLEILLSIAAVSIFAVFAIKPTLVTIGGLITKINTLQETSDKLDTKIKNLGTAQSLFNNNEDKISLLNSAIPANPDLGNYIRQIEGVAKKDNLTIITITAAPVDLTESTPSGVITPSISVSGDYSSIFTFIQDLENLRHPNIIQKLSLETQSNVLTLSVTPDSPYLK